MNQSNELDLGPLTWVKSEIDLALARADEALGKAAAEPDATTHFQFAQTHVHQACGALSIVGLDGLTRFTTTLDQMLGAIARSECPASEANIAIATRALAAIGNYLEELIRGTPDQPMRLMPLYTEMATATGQTTVSPSALFYPDLSRRPGRAAPRARASEADWLDLMRKARARFERGLLQWLKNGKDSAGPIEMREAAAELEAMLESPAPASLWWAAQAFFDALAHGDLADQPAVRGLCPQLAKELRQLQRNVRSVPEALMRELLYWIAQAPERTERQREVRALWQLDALMPAPDSGVTEIPLAPLLKGMHAELGACKRAWDDFCDGQAAALPRFEQHLTSLLDQSRPLGRPSLERLFRGLCDFNDWLRKDPLQFQDRIAIEMATALLLAEVSLDRGLPDAGFNDQVADTLSRLDALTRGEDIQAAELSPTVEAARRMQEKQARQQVAKEIQTNLAHVEQALDDYFRNQAKRAPLAGLALPLKQIAGALSLLGDEQAIALVNESAETVEHFANGEAEPQPGEFEELAHRLSALGFYIDAIQHGPAELDHFLHPSIPAQEEAARADEAFESPTPDLDALPTKPASGAPGVRSTEALFDESPADEATALDDAPFGRAPSDLPPLPGIEEFDLELDLGETSLDDLEALDTAAEASRQASPASAEPAFEESVSTAEGDAAIDAELLDIFLEEATEVLGSIAIELAELEANPDNHEALTAIRRSFHTLKGSGRMVGLTDLGEAAWSLEQTLNRWLQLEWPPTSVLTRLISNAHQLFGDWVRQIASGQGLAYDATEILADAERLREAETPEAAADIEREEPAAREPAADLTPEEVTPEQVTSEEVASEEVALEEITSDESKPEDVASERLSSEELELEIDDSSFLLTLDGLPPSSPDHPDSEITDDIAEPLATAQASREEGLEEISLEDHAEPWPEDLPQADDADLLPEAIMFDGEPDILPEAISLDEATESSKIPKFDSSADSSSDDAGIAFGPEAAAPPTEEAEPAEDSPPALAAELGEEPEVLSIPALDGEPELASPVLDFGDLDFPAVPSQVGSDETDESSDTDEPRDAAEWPEPSTPAAPTELSEATELTEATELADSPELAEPTESSAATERSEPTEPQADAVSPAPALTAEAVQETSVETTVDRPALPDTVRLGDAEISRSLFDLYRGEAKTHIAVLHEVFAQLQRNPTRSLPEPAQRAAHTLAGISGTARIPPVQRLARALEHAIERLRELDHPPSADDTELMQQTRVTLEAMLADVSAERLPLDVPELETQLDQIGREDRALRPLPPEQTALVTESLAAEPLATAAPQDVSPEPSAPVHDDLDEQLLPIFLEEGADLIAQLHSTLRTWQDNQEDPTPAKATARLLHTLKGSARMAGAMRLGEHVHQLESRLELALKVGSPTPTLLDELVAGLDATEQQLDQIAHPESAQVAAGATGAQPGVEDDVSIEPAQTGEAAITSPTLRVRADTVDRFVNEAGEIGIARTRIEGELRTLRRSLLDLTENVIRLRNQLREVELQADMQMQSRIAQAESENADFDPLEMDRYTRLQELTRLMAESVGDVTTVQQNLLRNLDGAELALNGQARLSRDLQQALMQVRMVPFESLADRLHRVVRQSAKDLGKRVNLDLRGGRIEIDRSVLEHMTAPLEHLLRNAVAHGIETAEARVAAGKDSIGEIKLSVQQEGNEIAITLSDDGIGLDHGAILNKAREKGLVGPDEQMDERRLTNLIFVPGFSTASNVSAVSGRGVGMDVVKAETASVGGRIDVNSIRGQGTTFRIYLPVTLAVTQALLVKSGARSYAIPSSMIAQVMELRADALQQIIDDGGVEWQGQFFAYRYMPHLLGERSARAELQRFNALLLLHAGAQTLALHVESLRGNQEIVVKNAGPQLVRIVGITGATVLGDGEIVLIVNPVALASRSLAEPAGEPSSATTQGPIDLQAADAAAQQATVMIVDDSLTVRKITGRLLEREGYRVVSAKDGTDALEKLLDSLPDVILSDIEMPRMDGFDLLRNIRADARTQAIPVIMITSRLADKHREHAMKIGANEYLGKPFDEDELLRLIRGFTTGRF